MVEEVAQNHKIVYTNLCIMYIYFGLSEKNDNVKMKENIQCSTTTFHYFQFGGQQKHI